MRKFMLMLASLLTIGCEANQPNMVGLKEVLEIPSVPFRSLVWLRDASPKLGSVSINISSELDYDNFKSMYSDMEIPKLDFKLEQGILVSTGMQGKPKVVEVVAIEEQQTRLLVHTVQWESSPSEVAPDVISYPYHYVSIPRTSKPVEFAPMVKAYFNQRPKSFSERLR